MAVAWSVGSRLDAAQERSMLIAMVTVCLSLVLADPAVDTTSPSPTPLWRRRSAAGSIGLVAVAATWAVTRLAAAAMFGRTTSIGRWELLEFAVVASSQVAIGAVTTRGRSAPSIGPGLLVAAGWFATVLLPRVNGWFYEVDAHRWLWVAMLVACSVAAALASIDPARRSPLGL